MIGETLGNYRVIKQLGQGGMGIVYLAEHTMLGKRAAIKLLLPEFSREQHIVTRFFNEARATTVIRHAGIVEVFDFGYHHSGSAYIVMEFLHGESLSGLLAREQVPPFELTAVIGRQIASALGAAHEAGIVHRDLKPDNVYLVPERDFPMGIRVKVLDFGIAKLAGDANLASNKTKTGSVMGTAYYMSPEQCRGDSALDHRADIYSLGCMLYEMACGQRPFGGEAVGAIMGGHLHLEPAPPRQLNRAVPAALESLILGMLAKEPGDRPQSMNEVMAVLGGEQPARRPPASTPGPLRKQSRPQPVPTTMGGAAAQMTEPMRRGRPLLWAAVVVAGVAAAAGAYFVLRKKADKSAGTAGPAAPLPTDCSGAAAARCVEHGEGLLAATGKERNDALASQLFRRACDAGDARGCRLAGTALRDGVGGARDVAAAAVAFEGACKNGELEACVDHGMLLARGTGVPADLARALTMFQRACDGAVGRGCAEAATLYRWGRGVTQDLARAHELAAAGCKADSAEGCAVLAEHLSLGVGTAKDADAAAKAVSGAPARLSAACERGAGDACLALGSLLAGGHGVERDYARAGMAFDKACASAVSTGCLQRAWQFFLGRGVLPDEVRGAEILRRAAPILQAECDHGNESACGSLGFLHAEGRGVSRDSARAGSLLTRGCDGGDGESCLRFADMVERGDGVAKDSVRAGETYRRALTLLERDCKGGDGWRCSKVADAYVSGRGYPKDAALARSFYGLGCQADDADACVQAGLSSSGAEATQAFTRAIELLEAECTANNLASCDTAGDLLTLGPLELRKPERARGFYQTACDGSLPDGCYDLGYLFAHGVGVDRDSARAATLWQTACDRGSGLACNNLGYSYQTGDGVAKDAARAMHYYQKGCDVRDAKSCASLGKQLLQGDGVDKDKARARELFQKACNLGMGEACKFAK